MPNATMRLTAAQHLALRDIKTGGMYFNDKTGGANYRHNPKCRIYRVTLCALFRRGLVEYDGILAGRLILTDDGWKAVSR